MCSGAGHTTRLVRGSPTRRSSDQRSVDSSPRLIAASYVLHRLLVPRHPPCALNNLTTQKPPIHARKDMHERAYKPFNHTKSQKDARVHCAVLNDPPDTGHPTPRRPAPPTRDDSGMRYSPALRRSIRSLRTQQRAYDRSLRPDSGPRTPEGTQYWEP